MVVGEVTLVGIAAAAADVAAFVVVWNCSHKEAGGSDRVIVLCHCRHGQRALKIYGISNKEWSCQTCERKISGVIRKVQYGTDERVRASFAKAIMLNNSVFQTSRTPHTVLSCSSSGSSPKFYLDCSFWPLGRAGEHSPWSTCPGTKDRNYLQFTWWNGITLIDGTCSVIDYSIHGFREFFRPTFWIFPTGLVKQQPLIKHWNKTHR